MYILMSISILRDIDLNKKAQNILFYTMNFILQPGKTISRVLISLQIEKKLFSCKGN